MDEQPKWLLIKQKMTLYHLTNAWMVERFYTRGVPIRDYNLYRFLRGERNRSDDYRIIADTAESILASYEEWLALEKSTKEKA